MESYQRVRRVAGCREESVIETDEAEVGYRDSRMDGLLRIEDFFEGTAGIPDELA